MIAMESDSEASEEEEEARKEYPLYIMVIRPYIIYNILGSTLGRGKFLLCPVVASVKIALVF